MTFDGFLPDFAASRPRKLTVHCHHCEDVQLYGIKLGFVPEYNGSLWVQYLTREDAENRLTVGLHNVLF